jgi:hypothetical protein
VRRYDRVHSSIIHPRALSKALDGGWFIVTSLKHIAKTFVETRSQSIFKVNVHKFSRYPTAALVKFVVLAVLRLCDCIDK